MSVTVAVDARRRLALHQTQFLKIFVSGKIWQTGATLQTQEFPVSLTILHFIKLFDYSKIVWFDVFFVVTWCDTRISPGGRSMVSSVELRTPSQRDTELFLTSERQLEVDWQEYSSAPRPSANPDKLNLRLDLHRLKNKWFRPID